MLSWRIRTMHLPRGHPQSEFFDYSAINFHYCQVAYSKTYDLPLFGKTTYKKCHVAGQFLLAFPVLGKLSFPNRNKNEVLRSKLYVDSRRLFYLKQKTDEIKSKGEKNLFNY